MAQGALGHDQALLNNAKVDLDRYKHVGGKRMQFRNSNWTRISCPGCAVSGHDQARYGEYRQRQSATDLRKDTRRPITGSLSKTRLVDPGNIVHATRCEFGIVVITQVQPIAVLFTIPEDSLPQVTQKLRAGAHLSADAYSRDNSKKLASGMLNDSR